MAAREGAWAARSRPGRRRHAPGPGRGPETLPALGPLPSRTWSWLGLALLLGLTALLRLRLLSVPLERDEGEYAYAGQLLLRGIPPYTLACNMKFPGIYAAYALLLALFGHGAEGIHFGLLLINAACILLVHALARPVAGRLAAIAAAGSFALLSLGAPVLGLAAHATHFVLLPALAGLVLLLAAKPAPGKGRILAGGILLGSSVLMKQPGALFVVLGAGLVVARSRARAASASATLRDLLLFAAAAVFPLFLTAALLARAGVLGPFWFWTFEYAARYATQTTWSQGLELLADALRQLVSPAFVLFAFAAAALPLAALEPTLRPRLPFLLAFTGASFLATCPGLYFREHYFVLLLPAVALLAGTGLFALRARLARARVRPWLRAVPAAVFAAGLLQAGTSQRAVLFQLSPLEVSRSIYGANPFAESIVLARAIESRSLPGDRVAVLGSEPQIYFLSRRLSATRHIYTYALMEPQPFAERMQREMIAEIEAVRPRFLVVIDVPTSWLVRDSSPRLLFEWLGRYAREHYRRIGVAEILGDRTDYLWDEGAAGFEPRSDAVVYLLERKSR